MIMIGLTIVEDKYRIYRSIADYLHESETKSYWYRNSLLIMYLKLIHSNRNK